MLTPWPNLVIFLYVIQLSNLVTR